MKSLTFLAFLSPAQCLVQGLGGLLSSVDAIISAAEMATSDKSFNSFIDAVEEGAAPTTVDQATFATELARNESNGNPLAYIGLLKLNGILNPLGEQASGCGEPCTAKNTGNPTLPGLYQQTQGDAPWSEPETSLTSSVYFPPQYTFGEKIPLLFVPGTGNYGKQSFSANMGQIFAAGSVVDPVYLNVPEYLLGDAQVNGEYVAYAAKYVSGVSNNATIGIMTWSQGAVDTAWALQYWPSAREVVADVINISAGYKGTPLLDALCLLPVCEYSLWQQRPGSNFIDTLREGGGSSAYVPTTSIMSLTDEFVPQLGGESASGYIFDVRHVGATNVFVQEVCAGQLGGGVYTHSGTMASNLAYELALDALTHDGPGHVGRLNLDSACGSVVIEGMSVLDVVETENTSPVTLYNIFTHKAEPGEPPIRPYAM